MDLYKKEQGETVREETKEDKARREEIENAPIVQLINSVIEQAVDRELLIYILSRWKEISV